MIHNDAELKNTREKLRLLEERYAALDDSPSPKLRARELTRMSLKKLANQMKEEIARYETQSTASTRD